MYKIIEAFLGKKLTDQLVDKVTSEIAQVANNKLLEYLVLEYERNSKTKTILHRSHPIELTSFYQPLFIRKQSFFWLEDDNKCVPKDRISTCKIEELFVESKNITIIGNAGSGKSTLVKYLYIDSIATGFKIPIKVELRHLNDNKKSLISYIKEEVLKFSGIADEDSIIERLMSSGDYVIFLDGYDEISTKRKEIITKEIDNLTKKYSKNYYILTSRPFANIELLETFHNYVVCDLSKDEIKQFVQKQFNKEEVELARKIINTIEEEDTSTYDTFLSNPLLLSMFIMTYQTDSHIPQKRSEYYSQVFDTLFSMHDTSSKLGYIREKLSGLAKEDFVSILERFSVKSYFEQKFSFSDMYLRRRFNEVKGILKISFNNDSFINDLVVAIGIISKEGKNYTFPHRSLQEYFAAQFISNLSENVKKDIYAKLLSYIISKSDININMNLCLLLKEMDNIYLSKFLVIPFLQNTNRQIDSIGTMSTSEIINLFTRVLKVSCLINKEVADTYQKQNNIYQENFSTKVKTDSKNIEKIIEKARVEISNDFIKPFIMNFDFLNLINILEKELLDSETIDSDFVKSL